MTESEKLVMGVESEALLQTASARESWRIFGIMSEFVEVTERLAAINTAIAHIDVMKSDPGSLSDFDSENSLSIFRVAVGEFSAPPQANRWMKRIGA